MRLAVATGGALPVNLNAVEYPNYQYTYPVTAAGAQFDLVPFGRFLDQNLGAYARVTTEGPIHVGDSIVVE